MAARSAGGSTRASEPEGSAYTLTFRADDGAGVPSGLGETEVEVDFGEQHDRVPHVSDDGAGRRGTPAARPRMSRPPLQRRRRLTVRRRSPPGSGARLSLRRARRDGLRRAARRSRARPCALERRRASWPSSSAFESGSLFAWRGLVAFRLTTSPICAFSRFRIFQGTCTSSPYEHLVSDAIFE